MSIYLDKKRIHKNRKVFIVRMDASTSLRQLVEMGFEESVCTTALQRSNGNIEAAMDMLLSRDVAIGRSRASTSVAENITMLEMSQYSLTDRSSSACTSIAWTFVSSALAALKAYKSIENVECLSEILLEGVSSFESVSSSSGGTHLSVEEFLQLIPTQKGTRLCGQPRQCLLTERNIRDFLINVYEQASVVKSSPVGIVITKPPETVAVLISADKCYFFDSHSRPEYGIDGAYLVSCTDIEGVVNRLCLVFPPMESTGDSMMDMMYGSFEASAFQLESI